MNEQSWKNKNTTDKQIHFIQNMLKPYDEDLIEALEEKSYNIDRGLACELIKYLGTRGKINNKEIQDTIKKGFINRIKGCGFYFVTTFGEVSKTFWDDDDDLCNRLKSIGNCYQKKEDAEMAAKEIRNIFKKNLK